MTEYDESSAISFIRQHLGEIRAARYSDDDIIEVIDLTFDFFEQYSDDDDIDIEVSVAPEGLTLIGEDAESLFDYVRHLIAKDKKSNIQQEDIPAIVTGELLYEDTLNDSMQI